MEKCELSGEENQRKASACLLRKEEGDDFLAYNVYIMDGNNIFHFLVVIYSLVSVYLRFSSSMEVVC